MASHLTRAAKCLSTEFSHALKFNNVSVQSVRWRKPRWIPKSQSKIFYVRTPTPIIQEEYDMLRSLYSVYNTKVKALRLYFRRAWEAEKSLAKSRLVETDAQVDEDRFQEAMEKNRLWNEECARLRSARLEIEDEKKLRKDVIQEEKLKKQREQSRILAEQHIQNTAKSAEKFITLENLDEEIEKMLNSRSDYNFSINTKGAVIKDETYKSEPKEKQESAS